GGYGLAGNPIVLNAGLANNSSNSTFNTITLATITLGASQTFSSGTAGSLLVSSAVNLGRFTLTLDGTSLAGEGVSGNISGAGGIVKNGSGVWSLGTATTVNTYLGLTTVNAGTLSVGGPNAFGAASAGTVVNAGGTLGLIASSAYTISEPLTLSGNGGTVAG